jgi:thiol-disulfide isomerase/thioredoxin
MIRPVYVAAGIGVAMVALIWGVLTYEPAPPPQPAGASGTVPPVGTAAGTVTSAPIGTFVPLVGGDFTQVAPLDGVGKPADMSSYRGKALLVNLWATWCAPCIEELPSLGKLQQARGGDTFAVVTIAIDERDPAKIEPFLAGHGAANLPALIDVNRTIDKMTPVSALPTSLLVDRDGKARAMLAGDARWHCGKALAAIDAFIKNGAISTDVLEPCE